MQHRLGPLQYHLTKPTSTRSTTLFRAYPSGEVHQACQLRQHPMATAALQATAYVNVLTSTCGDQHTEAGVHHPA